MASPSAWSGALRWLAAALLVAVLSLGPSVDSLICGNDLSSGAAAAEITTSAGQTVTAPLDDHGSAPADVCIHGHCHHFAPFVPIEGVGGVGADLPSAKHVLGRTAVRKTDPHFGLKRPPRG